jgi:hypothetical protein
MMKMRCWRVVIFLLWKGRRCDKILNVEGEGFVGYMVTSLMTEPML